jgi:hypothetical protein
MRIYAESCPCRSLKVGRRFKTKPIGITSKLNYAGGEMRRRRITTITNVGLGRLLGFVIHRDTNRQSRKKTSADKQRKKEKERDGENGSSPVSLEPFLAYYILCKERQCVAPEWRSGEKRGCCVFFHRPSIELEMERMKRVCTINLRWATGRTARYIRE